MPTLTVRCNQCPTDGGAVVALIPGQEPGHRAGRRAWELTRTTGHHHHDHYDPGLDAFLIIDDES